jgi:hypothetical protein
VIIKVLGTARVRSVAAGQCGNLAQSVKSVLDAMRCKGAQAEETLLSGRPGCGEKAASEEGACCWLGPRPFLATRDEEGATSADRHSRAGETRTTFTYLLLQKTARRQRQDRAARVSAVGESEGDW